MARTSTPNWKFSALLKEHLENKKKIDRKQYSQAALASYLKVDDGTLSNWATAGIRPRDPEIIQKIADFLRLTTEQRIELLEAAGYDSVAKLVKDNAKTASAPKQDVVTTGDLELPDDDATLLINVQDDSEESELRARRTAKWAREEGFRYVIINIGRLGIAFILLIAFLMFTSLGQQVVQYLRHIFNPTPAPAPIILPTPVVLSNPLFGEAMQIFAMGQLLMRDREIEEAIDNFTLAIEVDPNYADAYAERGMAYHQLSEHNLATNDLDRAIRLKPDDWHINKIYGIVYAGTGQHDIALESAEKVISLAPNPVDAYGARAMIYLAMGETEKAIKDYAQAIELAPDNKNAYSNRGMALYNLGQLDAALTDLNKVIELGCASECNDGSIYLYRARIHGTNQRYTEAIADLTKALEFSVNMLEVYMLRGSAYLQLRQGQEAAADFTRVIELTGWTSKQNLEISRAHFMRGRAHVVQGRFDLALDDFNQFLLQNPENAEVYLNRGVTHRLLEDYIAAEADFEKTLQLAPNHSKAHHQFGLLYWQQRAYDMAVTHFTAAIEAAPSEVWLRYDQGLAYYKLGEYQRAMASFKAILEGDAENVPSHAMLCLIGNETGEANRVQHNCAKLGMTALDEVTLDKLQQEFLNPRGDIGWETACLC